MTTLELKKDFEREMLLRRYRAIAEGKLPIEDEIVAVLRRARRKLLTSWRIFIKRTLDFVFASVGLVFAAPVMLVIAALVKLDSPGPALFKQTRVGMKGTLFNIYKFRSMRMDAESKTGPVWATENDPRVTPLGRFLRQTHLDEIPQLFNILKGEMSMVGPRPERPHFVEQFRQIMPNYDERLTAKPGITGLAQIKRRYDSTLSDVKKKLRYDLVYVRRMCPLLDVKVIALTIVAVLMRTGR